MTRDLERKPVEAAAESHVKDTLEAQLRALCREDDFAGGLPELHRYPEFEDRELSHFELDLRDWGFVYGLAFGLVMREHPELPHLDAARLALGPARGVWVSWGGEIENPAEKREAAIRRLVDQYGDVDREPDTGLLVMTRGLEDALAQLSESARG